MRRQILGVVTIVLGLVVAGCSLPEVYPLASGPTGGPSPYGAWYEQHWVTNAILLAGNQPQESAEASSQPSEAAEPASAQAGDSAAKPHVCCNKPGCPHKAAAAAESQSGAPADGADAKPTPVPATHGKSTDKLRY